MAAAGRFSRWPRAPAHDHQPASTILPLSALLAACLLYHGGAAAQPAASYPAKPIRIVIPFQVGGTNDIAARALAEQLALAFKQPVSVENRPGAGGLVGTEYVAKAPPDGYTLLVSNAGSLAAGFSLQAKAPYNVLTDFTPVSLLADVTIVLVVHPSVPARSVPELIALARARSGGLIAALPGVGTIEQLLTALFRQRTGVDIEFVPYKRSGRAMVDLISGAADMAFINLAMIDGWIRAKRLIPIAVASARRSEQLPDVPTTGELGRPDIVAAPWIAMLAPAATPREVVIRLNANVMRIMRTPDMMQYLGNRNVNALWSTPEETQIFIREEIEKWAEVVKRAGNMLE